MLLQLSSSLRPIHPLEVFLVVFLNGLPFELEGGRHEARFWRPKLGAEGHRARKLKLLKACPFPANFWPMSQTDISILARQVFLTHAEQFV